MHKLNKSPAKNSNRQSGVVSILVSVIIMIVLTLIAIGFAQIMRREQRQALDRQLSTQAYYAAETAINDATQALIKGTLGQDHNTCTSASGDPLGDPVIDASLGIEYSCVTFDSSPESLEYDAIATDNSMQLEFTPTNAAGADSDLKDLTIYWQDPGQQINFETAPVSASGNYLPYNWPADSPGILRVEIIFLDQRALSTVDRASLVNARRVFWLYPARAIATPAIPWGAVGESSLIAGNCDATDSSRPKHCAVTITGLPTAALTDESYLIRMRSIYRQTEATIKGELTDGTNAFFRGAQVEIDATGKVGDVLRRMSARVSVGEDYAIPEYSFQSFDGVCKQLRLVDATDVVYSCY